MAPVSPPWRFVVGTGGCSADTSAECLSSRCSPSGEVPLASLPLFAKARPHSQRMVRGAVLNPTRLAGEPSEDAAGVLPGLGPITSWRRVQYTSKGVRPGPLLSGWPPALPLASAGLQFCFAVAACAFAAAASACWSSSCPLSLLFVVRVPVVSCRRSCLFVRRRLSPGLSVSQPPRPRRGWLKTDRTQSASDARKRE